MFTVDASIVAWRRACVSFRLDLSRTGRGVLLVIRSDIAWGGVAISRKGHIEYLMTLGCLSGKQVEILSKTSEA